MSFHRHAGEVIPGLWVGDIRSVSYIDDIIQTSTNAPIHLATTQNKVNRKNSNTNVRLTVISVMSSMNLMNYVADLLREKQKDLQNKQHQPQNELQYRNIDVKLEDNSADEDMKDALNINSECSKTQPIVTHADQSHNSCDLKTIDICHVQVPLRDSLDADLMTVLNETSASIDNALGMHPNHQPNLSNNHDVRICLVHCAKGASRSVSIIIGYLLSRHPNDYPTFNEALECVRKVRPQAMPNVQFAIDLRKYARDVHNS